MKQPVERFLFWTPKVLCILFALFVSVLALDVFGQGYGFWGTALALLIHLIPTGIIVAVLVISWHREWLAAVVFIVAGILYLFSTLQHLDWVLAISGPLWLIGVLFMVSWLYRRKLRAGS